MRSVACADPSGSVLRRTGMAVAEYCLATLSPIARTSTHGLDQKEGKLRTGTEMLRWIIGSRLSS